MTASVVAGVGSQATRVSVHRHDGRFRTRLQTGLLRPQLLHGSPDRCRIGLLATTALLLGGDRVELDVQVGPGVRLELVDVAGTVAYDGRGHSASWEVRVAVARGGWLRWAGEPLVVADGADVTRDLSLELGEDAGVLLRETAVLGRAGQLGGVLRSRTRVHRQGRPVLVEDTELDPARHRRSPGMLGSLRVVDTLLTLGVEPRHPGPDATLFRLSGRQAHLTRYLGTDLAASPLHRIWAETPLPNGS